MKIIIVAILSVIAIGCSQPKPKQVQKYHLISFADTSGPMVDDPRWVIMKWQMNRVDSLSKIKNDTLVQESR